MPTVVSPTRGDSLEIMAVLDALTAHSCQKPQYKRSPLVMLGGSNDQLLENAPTGYFRLDYPGRDWADIRLQRDENGKVQSAILYYKQRGVDGDVVTSRPDGICTTGALAPRRNQLYDISSIGHYGRQLTFDWHAWQTLIEAPDQSTILDEMLTAANAVLYKADTDLLTQVITGQGGNVKNANNDPVTIGTIGTYPAIQLYNATNGTVNAVGVEALQDHMEDNEMTATCWPAVITQQNSGYSSFLRMERFACCNDAGFNGSGTLESLGHLPIRGKNVHAAFVAAGLSPVPADSYPSVVIEPGAAQLIEIFDHKHEGFNRDGGALVPWTDPISGEMFDLRVQQEDCKFGPVVHVHFYKRVKAVTMPSDLYQSGDPLEKLNGVMLYNFDKVTS